MTLNDTLNELGMAVHNAAIASQKLEGQLREAADRVATLNDKNEKVRTLEKQIQALSTEVQELEDRKNQLKGGIDTLLSKFK